MAMEFYEAARTTGCDGVRVMLVKKGLTFNAAAVESYLSGVKFARLGFDADAMQIGVLLLEEYCPGCLKIVRRTNKHKKTDRAYVNCQGFFTKFQKATALIDQPLVFVFDGKTLLLSKFPQTQKLSDIDLFPGRLSAIDETHKFIHSTPHPNECVGKRGVPMDEALTDALAKNDSGKVAELARGIKMRKIYQCFGCSYHGAQWPYAYPEGHPQKCPKCGGISFEAMSVPDQRSRRRAHHRVTPMPLTQTVSA